MAGPPAGVDPYIPPKEAPSRALEESIEAAAQRLQRVRANLRLPDRPFAPPSEAHDDGLRSLGLLDFVCLELSSSGRPRPDLVAELIANYRRTPGCNGGWSSVHGKEIEVSPNALAEALCLPERPALCPPADVDSAVVASAAQEFGEIYFQQRKHYGLVDEALRAVEDGRAHDIDWKVLIWVQVRHEMVHLVEKKSTDRVTYYTAYLQRLICVQRPELFQVPPEEPALPIQKRLIFVQRPELFQLPPDDSDQPLSIKKKRGRDRASVVGNKKHCSESDMSTAQARSKKIHSAFEKFDVASKKVDATSKKFDMQKTEERSKKIDLASKKIDATSNKFDSTFKNFAAASKKIDATSKKFDLASKMIEAT